mgnify:CR=1 FL=1
MAPPVPSAVPSPSPSCDSWRRRRPTEAVPKKLLAEAVDAGGATQSRVPLLMTVAALGPAIGNHTANKDECK